MVSVTSIEGGIAGNVVPDLVEATVNFRYAPTRTPDEAEARLRLVARDRRCGVHGDRQRAHPHRSCLATRWWNGSGAAGDLEVGPKQAWTPVAEFATIGVDAVNFGPGDPQYAHRDDERVAIEALVRSTHVLRRFLSEEREG